MDCRKVWELLISKKLKASQLIRYGGSKISKIVELENKTKVEYEHVHVKTKDNENDAIEKKVYKWR